MFKDLNDYLSPTLDLPIGGKVYQIPSPPMEVGLYLQFVDALILKRQRGEELTEAELAKLNLDDQGETDFYRMILGDVFDEMKADGVPWHAFRHVAATVMAWVNKGIDEAELMWNSVGPKAPRAPQDRKPKSSRPKAKARPRDHRQPPAPTADAGQ